MDTHKIKQLLFLPAIERERILANEFDSIVIENGVTTFFNNFE